MMRIQRCAKYALPGYPRLRGERINQATTQLVYPYLRKERLVYQAEDFSSS
jgi:hypothetical protein